MKQEHRIIKSLLFMTTVLVILGFSTGCGGSETDDISDNTLSDSQDLANDDGFVSDFSMSEEEAYEQGGLYVKSGEQYYPLPELRGVDQSWGERLNLPTISVYYSDASGFQTPTLKSGDELVLFTSGDIPEFEALEVKKEGYTVDAVFWKNRVTEGIGNAQVYVGGQLGDNDYKVETINGTPYEDFFSNETINAGDYCTNINDQYDFEDQEPICQVVLAEMDENETISMTYHQGTESQTIDLTANQKYFIIDGCTRYGADEEGYSQQMTTGSPLKVELSDGRYGMVDTTALKSNTFIIRSGMGHEGYAVIVE